MTPLLRVCRVKQFGNRVLKCLPLWLASVQCAGAQSLPPLQEFQGTYAYAAGQRIEIIAGAELFAVLDQVRYQLSRVDGDAFLTGAGDTIRFRRATSGTVDGFWERGVLYPRRSVRVTASALALVSSAPRGQSLAVDFRYTVPEQRDDGIPVGNIAESDLDTATAGRVARSVIDGTNPDVHAVLLFQRGKLVFEEYFYGYGVDSTHQLRSVTKSFVGALAGIAVDLGLVAGIRTPAVSVLPYRTYAFPDPRKNAISLGDLLTMRSGLACNDYDGESPGREAAIYASADWVKAMLDLPLIEAPGTAAHYCSVGVAVTGRMIERASHVSLPAFAQARLFAPMGVRRDQWTWNYTLTGANREFSQLHMRPRDMLKFGILYANGGVWAGTRIVSASWVDSSLAEQTQIDGTGYGYFWWKLWLTVETPTGNQRVYLHAAQGNGGQSIFIVPELDLVAVFTGGDYNSGGSTPSRIMAGIVLPRLIAARARP